MRLRIELVPSALWKVNLRTFLSFGRWKSLREAVYKSADFTCEICGYIANAESGISVNAHEEWAYNDASSPPTTTLHRLGCICKLCHHAHHIGQLRNMIVSGEAAPSLLDEVISHFCSVNKCTPSDFEAEQMRAFKQFAAQSRIAFKPIWGRFGVLLGKRIELEEYGVLVGHDHRGRPEIDCGMQPWIGNTPIAVDDGDGIVHVVPLFDGQSKRGATKNALVNGVLSIERELRADQAELLNERLLRRPHHEFKMLGIQRESWSSRSQH